MEIIIGLSSLLGISLIASVVQTVRINKIKVAGIKSDTIIKEANRQADKTIRDAKFQAEKETKATVRRAEEDIAFKKRQLKEVEQDVNRSKQQVQQSKKDVERLQDQFEEKMTGVKELRKKQEDVLQQLFDKLESVASLTREEAEKSLVAHVEVVAKKRAGNLIKGIEAQARKVAKQRSVEIVLEAIQKLGVETVSSNTTSVVSLPDDEMKGRIIGKEGRNIRAFETSSGVDVVIDDTPNGVILSCFDPIRRETARIALDKLVNDGRINPARVEDALQKADEEIQQVIKQKGEKAADVLGLEFDPNIVEMLGRLNYRTSYGQNILDHSIECSKIAGIIADRLGVDVELAKRGAVLHDIGKAIDFVQEGSHDDLGAEICRKYGESAEVLNCIMAHHEDEEPDTVEAVIVKVADALSSARPGARKESVELYLKRLENLEKIAMEFDGVEKVYAIQAGREVRVLVRPEDVTDEGVYKLSQDIAERIEREMDYPGEVKVNLVRETRAVSIAH
ncbi:ribonuclease Y [Candidatus Marinamargulisbacteria bacterium SCGC AG-343-K17]|nr:ribonuclease Y [Candidatus Marinamargulisbacteria bacterium SCGC AG-343-K17]